MKESFMDEDTHICIDLIRVWQISYKYPCIHCKKKAILLFSFLFYFLSSSKKINGCQLGLHHYLLLF